MQKNWEEKRVNREVTARGRISLHWTIASTARTNGLSYITAHPGPSLLCTFCECLTLISGCSSVAGRACEITACARTFGSALISISSSPAEASIPAQSTKYVRNHHSHGVLCHSSTSLAIQSQIAQLLRIAGCSASCSRGTISFLQSDHTMLLSLWTPLPCQYQKTQLRTVVECWACNSPGMLSFLIESWLKFLW